MGGSSNPGPSVIRAAFPARALAGLGLLAAFAFLGPLAYPVDPAAIDLSNITAGASPAHPLGTDESGRDVLARLMHGGRVSLVVGVAAGLVALLVGTVIGGIATTGSGWVESVAGRLVDAAMALPAFFILLVTLTLFGGSTGALVLAIGATAWMGIARLVRAEALSLRERDWIVAARALGKSPLSVFARHILPHLVPTLAVAATVGVAHAVLTESALSFLGLGVQPPRPSWGNMLTGAQLNLAQAPWLAVYPGVAIVLTVLACNAVGETVRVRATALPRSTRRRDGP